MKKIILSINNFFHAISEFFQFRYLIDEDIKYDFGSFRTDKENMAKDWKNIGNDIRKSINK